MNELTEIQNQVTDSLSLLEILKQACEHNYENAFASHAFAVVNTIIEKQSQILEALDKTKF